MTIAAATATARIVGNMYIGVRVTMQGVSRCGATDPTSTSGRPTLSVGGYQTPQVKTSKYLLWSLYISRGPQKRLVHKSISTRTSPWSRCETCGACAHGSCCGHHRPANTNHSQKRQRDIISNVSNTSQQERGTRAGVGGGHCQPHQQSKIVRASIFS